VWTLSGCASPQLHGPHAATARLAMPADLRAAPL
jgi:hypothetical protein